MGDRERVERRNRLLKSYYGVGQESSKKDPLSLDGADFDPSLFVKKVIMEKDLPELLREDNKTVAEIRSLDGDMKTLVYENYSKFISATETIKKMKNNVHDMESEMEKLKQNMAKISEGSANINTSLVEKRDRINQLGGVHSLLKKLQFVFELPAKLRICLEKQTYNQAYKYYVKTSDILKHYNHLPSFANIQAESDAIMKEMVVRLKKKLMNETTKSNELSECVRILLGLKEPPEKLWKDYLQFQLRELKKSLRNAEMQVDLLKPEPKKKPKGPTAGPKADASQAFEESDDDASSVKSDQVSVTSSRRADAEEEEMGLVVDPTRKLTIFNDIFLNEFTEFVSSFSSLFLKSSGAAQVLSEKDLKRAEADLLNVVDEVAHMYFSSIEFKCLTLSEDPKLVPTAFTFVAFLGKMFKDVNVLNMANPHARLADRNRSMTSNFLLSYTNTMFKFLLADTKASLLRISQQISQNQAVLSTSIKPFCAEFIENAKRHLSNLEVFLHSDSKFMGEHSQVFTFDILRVATTFWQSLLGLFFELGSRPQAASSTHDPLLLLLAKISQELESSVTSAFFLYVADTFSPGGRKAVAQDAKEAIKQSKEAAQKLLNMFVELTGQKLTAIIRNSIETKNWMGQKEPRKVSPVWDIVISDLLTIQKSCDLLFPEDQKGKAGSESGRSGRYSARPKAGAGGLGDSSFMTNIDKLFSDSIQIFGDVEFSRSAIMMAIVKINIKTMTECLRLCTMSRAGFQQVQVDIEFLRTRLWRFVTNEGLLGRLLDEVMHSAHNRCTDPVLMDSSVVQKIVGEATGAEPSE